MKKFHKHLTQTKWSQLSLSEQVGNIGAEVSRMIYFEKVKDKAKKEHSFFRALELLDLTIDDQRSRCRLGELLRMRELLCDLFLGERKYAVDANMIENYFFPFAVIARKKQKR